MTDHEKFLAIMKEQLKPALGCTEPIAVSYCAAVARKEAKGELLKLVCESSVNIIKNAASVIIPGTDGRCGVAMAAGCGAVAGDAELGLEVLKNLKPSDAEKVERLIEEGKIVSALSKNPSKLYVEVELTTTEDKVKAILDDGHTNIVYLEKNGNVLLDKRGEGAASDAKAHKELYSVLSIPSILDFVNSVDLDELTLAKDAIKYNTALAEYGFEHECGLCAGKNLKEMIEKKYLALDMANNASMWAASASDARMAGCSLPAMSNVGSGNQGITCTMPVIATAKFLKADYEKTVRAVALTALVTIYVKNTMDKLAPVCGVVTASEGSSCGIVYLLGGGAKEMEMAVKNVLGSLAGMFCDGAKGSCGLKVSTGANTAVQSALLAMNGHFASRFDGLVGATAEETIANYARLSKEGMCELDNVIMDIILKKENE